MLTDNLSEKGHLFLSSISIHPCKACLFISSSNTSQMLESPKKEAPLYQSAEMNNLLKTTSEFVTFQQTYAVLCGLHPPKGSIFSMS